MRFNTIGVSDGISMGTEGMSYSLQSRDLIADSIETVMARSGTTPTVAIPGCDKNMPGCLIAMGRLEPPAIMVYGGTIRAGPLARPHPRHRLGVPELRRIHRRHDQRGGAPDIVRHSCPGAGACGGMYTANTMASAIEALGMSLPYSSSTPAEDPAKLDECRRAGAAIRALLERTSSRATS
jgi:dihydroxy-acid dehydratase